MTNVPAVTVVIPLYNKGPHIARTIQSVLDQTEQNFEIIIVDGQSTDGGPSIVKSIKDRRIRFFEQIGSGVSSARNEGVSYSKSDFIAFLDADDEWAPQHLEILLKLRKKYPEAGVYSTAYLRKTSSSHIEMANFHGIPEKPWEGLLPNYFRSAALGESPVWTSAVGTSKQIFEEMSGFTTEAWWGEDTDLWGRIALKYPITFSWDGMAIYHTDTTNRASDKIEPIIENIFVISARNALRAEEVPPELKDDLIEYLASKQIQTACRNLAAGRPDLARNNLKNCKTRHLWKSKYWTLFWAHIPSIVFIKLKRWRSEILRTPERSSNLNQQD